MSKLIYQTFWLDHSRINYWSIVSFSAFTEEEMKILKLEMPEHAHQIILLDIDKEYAEQWVAWLLRLVASSIITSLGA